MIEDVVNKIKSILQANLPAKLAAIDTARGGGITLRGVANTDYFVAQIDMAKMVTFPALFILAVNTPAINMVAQRREFNHVIDIKVLERYVAVDSRTTENLQRRLWRYIEAIEDILNSDLTLGGTVINTQIVAHDYSETTSAGHEYEQEGGLRLQVLERIPM